MHSIDASRRALAIAAAALAGFVDAAGFLSANGYFVSFMSGNTTRLGVDLIEAPQVALIPASLIAGFVAGVTGGAIIAAKAGERRKVAVLGLVALLLALAALCRMSGAQGAMLALLVLAMGALNNTFQRGGEVTVGLTYMTGALVRMGQGLAARLMGTGGEAWSGWLFLWLGLSVGAVGGALGWTRAPEATLWSAALWAGGLALTARRLPAA
ncbi:YoaK family protein [Novosphingobium sp.]|uniref:YoaK family protein n=1 Tax=Novosphingobium sp. TaxID=1874826 RepID=UPI0035B16F8A